MSTSAAGPSTQGGPPVISGADHRVPATARPAFEHIATVADAFCREHLNDEYAQLSVLLTAKLARKRPSPLLRGDRRIWASAVIYALGRVNFLSDPSQTPHLPTEHLARLLDVKQTTMAAKGRTVMDLLGLDYTDTEFCLPSRLASHPTAWLVSDQWPDLRRPRVAAADPGRVRPPWPHPRCPGRCRDR